MPTAPNTPLILTTLQMMIQGLQVDNATFFTAANVTVGKIGDITNRVPAAEITQADDETKRQTTASGVVQGGQIDDTQEFEVEITLDYTNRQAAEVQLAKIRDSFTKAFHRSATLNLQGQVFLSRIVPPGKRGWTLRDGQTWRVYRAKLKVGYGYAVIVQP